jgi:hypothetical protein
MHPYRRIADRPAGRTAEKCVLFPLFENLFLGALLYFAQYIWKEDKKSLQEVIR